MNAVPTSLMAGTVRVATHRPGYVVETTTDWSSVEGQWDGVATPFQDRAWLRSWYDSLCDRDDLSPLLVTARDAATGEVAVRLPFVLHEDGRIRVIRFADLEISDYNAPVLGHAAPRDAAHAHLLWRTIRKSLPPADLVRLTKMPATVAGRPNPLALLPKAQPCAANGNLVVTGDDWDGWRHALPKVVRKELERSWRVFAREPGTAFEIITDPARAAWIVETMEAQQQTRMAEKGLDYALDDPSITRFYRDLVVRSLAGGFAVLTALTAGEEVVAALLGIQNGAGYVMIRISNASGHWSNCSPGRLIIERTMAALHAKGFRSFDMSIGNYDYKRRFGVEPVPLFDLTEALGLSGVPAAMRATAAGELRKRPELDRRVRGVMNRFAKVQQA